MKRNTVKMSVLAFFLALALGAARHAQAQDAKTPYPTSMAPLDQYLMDRDAEIALARTASPLDLAAQRQGYRNGFSGLCGSDRVTNLVKRVREINS